MFSPRLAKIGQHTPENRPEKVPHALKLDGENVLNCQLENVAFANALQLEAADATQFLSALIRRPCQVRSLSLSFVISERFTADTLRYAVTLNFDPVTLTFGL